MVLIRLLTLLPEWAPGFTLVGQKMSLFFVRLAPLESDTVTYTVLIKPGRAFPDRFGGWATWQLVQKLFQNGCKSAAWDTCAVPVKVVGFPTMPPPVAVALTLLCTLNAVDVMLPGLKAAMVHDESAASPFASVVVVAGLTELLPESTVN